MHLCLVLGSFTRYQVPTKTVLIVLNLWFWGSDSSSFGWSLQLWILYMQKQAGVCVQPQVLAFVLFSEQQWGFGPVCSWGTSTAHLALCRHVHSQGTSLLKALCVCLIKEKCTFIFRLIHLQMLGLLQSGGGPNDGSLLFVRDPTVSGGLADPTLHKGYE